MVMKKCCAAAARGPFKRKKVAQKSPIVNEGKSAEDSSPETMANPHAHGLGLQHGTVQAHDVNLQHSENARMLDTQRSFHSPRGSPELRNDPQDHAWDAAEFKSEWESVAQSGDRGAKKQVLAKVAADNYARYIGTKIHIPRSLTSL